MLFLPFWHQFLQIFYIFLKTIWFNKTVLNRFNIVWNTWTNLTWPPGLNVQSHLILVYTKIVFLVQSCMTYPDKVTDLGIFLFPSKPCFWLKVWCVVHWLQTLWLRQLHTICSQVLKWPEYKDRLTICEGSCIHILNELGWNVSFIHKFLK